MDSILLYSCNHKIKYEIQQEYRAGEHFVWCSQHYDARAAMGINGRIGYSSNPAQIMRHMMETAYPDFDEHVEIIRRQRERLTERAFEWWGAGEVTEVQFDEIARMAARSDIEAWRPLLYIIPVTESIRGRLTVVPTAERASAGGEYQIRDLRRDEFHVLQPDLVLQYG